MDELVEQELARYDENSSEFLKAIFAAQPYILTEDVHGYKEMLLQTKNTSIKKNIDKCEHCGGYDLVYINSEAAIVCRECSTNQNYGGNTANVLRANARFMGSNRIDSPHYYERKSHFIHIIRELSGECNTKIPPKVYTVIRAGEMTLNGARASLRKAKLSSYICSVPRILENLSPHTCVSISYENLRMLVNDFKQVSWAWDRLHTTIAPNRKSFIAYPFVLKKLCERRNLDYLCRDAKKVKSAHANVKLEKYWKAIVTKLNW
jgi:hypothetical protein